MSQKITSTGSLARVRAAAPPVDIVKIASRFLLVVFLTGGGYLFAVNQNAVRGYQIRTLEKEISSLKEKNTELKIAEADLRSLYRIESNGAGLEMEKLDLVKYLDEPGPVAVSGSELEAKLLSLTSSE